MRRILATRSRTSACLPTARCPSSTGYAGSTRFAGSRWPCAPHLNLSRGVRLAWNRNPVSPFGESFSPHRAEQWRSPGVDKISWTNSVATPFIFIVRTTAHRRQSRRVAGSRRPPRVRPCRIARAAGTSRHDADRTGIAGYLKTAPVWASRPQQRQSHVHINDGPRRCDLPCRRWNLPSPACNARPHTWKLPSTGCRLRCRRWNLSSPRCSDEPPRYQLAPIWCRLRCRKRNFSSLRCNSEPRRRKLASLWCKTRRRRFTR